MSGLLFAILSPFFWGFMNLLDKFVVSHRVKHIWCFGVLAGFVNLLYGVILSLFLDWSNVSFVDFLFPAIAGILLGSQFFLYYYLLKFNDVSRVIGFAYVYPVVVAVLSFLFLNERLSFISYIGMFLVLLGVVLLSYKKGMSFKLISLLIFVFIIVIALYEFFVKVSTSNLPELNGIAISQVFVGGIIISVLLKKSIRTDLFNEFKNLKWAFLTESLTFCGVLTLFYAMASLPATIVSSIAAIQPLIVVFLEFFASKLGLKTEDFNFRKKILSIALIVMGIIVLYLPELL